MKAPPALVLDNVAFRHGDRAVVSALSGCFPPGSMSAVVGANGAGKTTLLRGLAGLHPLSAGRIDRGGLRRSDIALLPQGSSLDRGFPIACLDVVALGAPGLGPFRSVRPAQRVAAVAALDRVGLGGLESRPVQALSAGQFQRLLFARTILQDAPVILLDEPFSAVDSATTEVLLTVLLDWHAQGRTLIVVLHDMELVRAHFPTTLLLTGPGDNRGSDNREGDNMQAGNIWNATAEVLPAMPFTAHALPGSSVLAQSLSARQAA